MCVCVCVCVSAAESGCRQQEAQVQLLERELEQQRSSRGPSRRRSNTSRQDSSSKSATSAGTTSISRNTSSGPSGDQHSQSLAGELAECGTLREGREAEGGGGGGGKEKENRPSNSTKRERREEKPGLGAASFLEEVEREFAKKASESAPVQKRQDTLLGNRPKVSTIITYSPYLTVGSYFSAEWRSCTCSGHSTRL